MFGQLSINQVGLKRSFSMRSSVTYRSEGRTTSIRSASKKSTFFKLVTKAKHTLDMKRLKRGFRGTLTKPLRRSNQKVKIKRRIEKAECYIIFKYYLPPSFSPFAFIQEEKIQGCRLRTCFDGWRTCLREETIMSQWREKMCLRGETNVSS